MRGSYVTLEDHGPNDVVVVKCGTENDMLATSDLTEMASQTTSAFPPCTLCVKRALFERVKRRNGLGYVHLVVQSSDFPFIRKIPQLK